MKSINQECVLYAWNFFFICVEFYVGGPQPWRQHQPQISQLVPSVGNCSPTQSDCLVFMPSATSVLKVCSGPSHREIQHLVLCVESNFRFHLMEFTVFSIISSCSSCWTWTVIHENVLVISTKISSWSYTVMTVTRMCVWRACWLITKLTIMWKFRKWQIISDSEWMMTNTNCH